MSDSSKHLNPDESDPFESALSERLLRRATEPLGMIDVRYAEEKYLRIVRWLGRCTALLDHLSRRYGVEDARAYGDRPFAILRRGAQLNISNTIQTFLAAGLSPGSLPGADSKTNALHSSPREAQQETWKDVRPSGLADILAERSTNPAVKPSSSSEGMFRISRRPPPRLLESDDSQISGRAATPMKDAKGNLVSPRSAPITQQMPLKNVRSPALRRNPGPELLSRPAETEELTKSPQFEIPPEGGTTNLIRQPARAQERPATDALKHRREDASASSRLHSLPLITPTIVRPRAERVPSPEPGANPRMRSRDAKAQDDSRSRASSIPSMTDAFESRDESFNAEKPELVLRRGDRETDDASPAPALPGSVKTPRGVSSAAVASEIPGESIKTERLDLVLREQQADQRIASSRRQETRSVESSGGARSGTNEFPSVESTPFTKRDTQTDSPPSYQAEARELQVEDISPRVIRSISERVMRAITLDLKLERERRGVTKWR